MFTAFSFQNVERLSFLRTSLFIIATIFLVAFAIPRYSHADYTPLNTQMGFGTRNNDVSNLQTFLASNPNIYPSGMVTGYYGPLTRDAVVQFQAHYGIDQVGRVGPQTMAKINNLISSGAGLDLTAPSIYNIMTANSGNNTNVSWGTDSNAQGQVYYATTPLQMTEPTGPGMSVGINGQATAMSNLNTNQNMTISSLLGNTNYYYTIMARDAAGNVSVSVPGLFKSN